MNLIKSLSENELQNITEYITRFHNPEEDYETENSRCSTEHFLRFWNRNKAELFKMFGEKFILTKDVRYEADKQDVVVMMIEEMDDYDGPFRQFNTFYQNVIDTHPAFEDMDDWNKTLIKRLFCEDNLAANTLVSRYYHDVTVPIGDKTITVGNNSDIKTMKFFKKFAEAYGGEDLYEKMRLRHSLVLNQRKLSGRLSLSIHPLDYMTMSDNACDWNSCMNWTEGGEYHAGTIEMMNSEYVVVAYLSAECDMDLMHPWQRASKDCETPWSNKKWRELFIVSDEVISEIKGYPYQSDVLSRIVLEWLKELKTASSSKTYTDSLCALTRDSSYVKIAGVEEAIKGNGNFDNPNVVTSKTYVKFYTNAMYNDFHTKDYHLMYVNNAAIEEYEDIYLNYSGESECVWCGETYDVSDASRIMCNCCISRGILCSCCDNYYDEDEIYFVDGDAYCPGCYEEYTAVDAITGDSHRKDDMYQVYVVEDEASNSNILNPQDIVGYFYTTELHKDVYWKRRWEKLFPFLEIKRRTSVSLVRRWGTTNIYYTVRESDINDELRDSLYPIY